MSLPTQVQKQIEAAQALEAQLHALPQPAPTSKDEPANDDAGDADAQPLSAEQTFQQDTTDQQDLTDPQGPTPEPTGDDAKWEHRYKVLQGKYNKEVPRLTRELREQGAQLNHLMQQVQQITTVRLAEGDFSSAASGVEISDTEREEYGDDLLDLVGRRALQAVLPEIRRIEAMIEELHRGMVGVTGEVQKSAHQKFIDALDNQHKSWRTLNTDAGFLEWLDQPDAYTGVARKDLLQDAVAKHDVQRATAFFANYEAEHGVQPTARRPAAQRQDTLLEAMAAPGRARPGSTTAPAQPDVWTRTQIANFYADVRRGAYRGKEAEMERIEKSIVAAAAQNRVLQQ